MAGVCVTRIKHDDPKCMSSSGKSLQIFLNDDGSYSGYCFACSKLVPDPYGDNPPPEGSFHVKTPEEIEEEINEIKLCPRVPFTYRAIDKEDWHQFGVRVLVSPSDGKTAYAIAHPYTRKGKMVGFKIKLIASKTMWNVGDVKDADLYGWELAKRIGGATLYITEGEEDAIALRKIFRTLSKSAEYDYAVVSLPGGVKSVTKCLGRMAEEIQQRFKDVVLVFDDDEPGHAAVKEARKIMPFAKVARLPEKDANECLKNGRLKAARDACVFQAEKPVGMPIRNVDDCYEAIFEPPVVGPSYPWESLNRMTYGQRRGELVSIGGGTGCGKTLIGHELAAWDAAVHGWKVLAIMMEETNAETYQGIAGKIANIPYHMPLEEGEPARDMEKLRDIITGLRGKVDVWDLESIEDPETTWAQITQVIRTKGAEYDLIMIDNATTLSEGLSASDKNDFLGKVNSDFAKFAKQFNFMAVMFSHLNAPPPGNRSHEHGGKVLESQFTGSRAAMRYSHIILGFERNKYAVEPNCSYITCIKNRKYGRTGRLKTFYSRNTGRLKEREWDDELWKDA